MQAYYQQVQPVLDDFDFILTPAAGTIYTIAELEANPIQLNSNVGYYTNFMNLQDCAAIVVPSGFMESGMRLGSLVAGIPQPLGIGKVELADGRWCSGFICEGYALEMAEDITAFGGGGIM